MGHALAPPPWHRLSLVVFGVGACLAFGAAILVFTFGVIATHGVYGSRMAWLLGVVLPLLALTAGLSWLTRRTAYPTERANTGSFRVLSIIALVLVAMPFVLVGTLLVVYLVIFMAHGVDVLVH